MEFSSVDVRNRFYSLVASKKNCYPPHLRPSHTPFPILIVSTHFPAGDRFSEMAPRSNMSSRPSSRQTSRRPGSSGISTPNEDVALQTTSTRGSRSKTTSRQMEVEIKVQRDIEVTRSGRGTSSEISRSYCSCENCFSTSEGEICR